MNKNSNALHIEVIVFMKTYVHWCVYQQRLVRG